MAAGMEVGFSEAMAVIAAAAIPVFWVGHFIYNVMVKKRDGSEPSAGNAVNQPGPDASEKWWEPEAVSSWEPEAQPLKGYHLAEIPRGELGELSKVQEELCELADSLSQGSCVMAGVEMADLVGALQHFLDRNLAGYTVKELAAQSDVDRMSKQQDFTVLDIQEKLTVLRLAMTSASVEEQVFAAVALAGHIQAFAAQRLGLTVHDLVVFADITKRAFDNGYR